MKNPMEVLRAKEQEINRIKKEIDALRIAAQLLGDEGQAPRIHAPDMRKSTEMQ